MAKRRDKGTGSIFELADGRYRASLELGYGPGGKRLRKTWTCKTKAEARAKLKEASRLVDDGFSVPDGKVTLGQFLERWLTESVAPSVKESALIQYRRTVRVHIAPKLGPRRLATLAPLDLAQLYREKLESGLSPATVLYVHRILHRALGQAVRWKLTHHNVAAMVDAPRLPRSTVSAFTPEQARAFMAAVKGDRLEALYLVSLAAGLRRGEVLALRWADVNFDIGSLAVQRSLSKVEGGWAFTEPKTASSRRVVKLPAFAVESLREHRIRQEVERAKAHVWADSSLVFATEIGTVIDGRNLLRLFKAHVKAAGMAPESFTFHGLRHSAATLMLALGVHPKVVAEGLGHSRVGITLDVYSSVLPHLQDEAAAKMDGLLAVPVAPQSAEIPAPDSGRTEVPDVFRKAFEGE